MTTKQQRTTNAQAGCLICGEPVLKRGLCGAHYGRFKRRIDSKPKSERLAFEEFLISKGMLARSQQGQRLPPDDDEFAIADAEFLALHPQPAQPPTPTPTPTEVDAEIRSVANGFVKPTEGSYPPPGRAVEILLSDSRMRRAEFLWNGFWMDADGDMIGSGSVIGWRPLKEPELKRRKRTAHARGK